MTGKEKIELKDGVINIFNRFNTLDNTATIGGLRDNILRYIDSLQEEPVSEDLEEAANFYANTHTEWFDADNNPHVSHAFKAGAQWQKQQDSIPSKDLAELIDTLSKRYPEVSFAKLSRIVVRVAKWQKEQVEEALLSEVLPCFMHGGEADEVVAKLDEVLNNK